MYPLGKEEIDRIHLFLEQMRNHLTTIKGLIQLDHNTSHKEILMNAVGDLENDISGVFLILHPKTKDGSFKK